MQPSEVLAPLPVACVAGAIAEQERAHHATLVARLFGELALTRQPVDNGLAFQFPSSAFPEVAAFVGNERKCCPFLNFDVQVAPGFGPITLTMTGPEMTQEFLTAELLDDSSWTMRNLRAGRDCCAGDCAAPASDHPVRT